MAYALHERIFRTICLFQALVAFPTMFWLGSWAWGETVVYGYEDVYHFVKHFILALFAAGILFIVIIQRYNPSTPLILFRFEVVKADLATAFWLWLILDSIFADPEHYSAYPARRRVAIAKSAVSVLVVLFLFFPTLIYAYLLKNQGDEVRSIGRTEGNGNSVSSERDALLGSEV